MSIVNQAIKIEQLKEERAKTINPLQLQLIQTEQDVRSVDNQIKELQKKRNALNFRRFELHERIYSHNQHFDLMIKAYQALSEKSSSSLSEQRKGEKL